MIISKTPLRVSLFGGGTDYPEYFNGRYGSVLGGTINKYIHTSLNHLAPISRENYRVQYREVESRQTVDQIKHPVVREVLKLHGDIEKINISSVSDLPGGTGLGSSSAFTVGLLKAICQMKGLNTSRIALAKKAIFIEREILKEKVGVQDQYHASFGGFSKYTFFDDATQITPIETEFPTFLSLNRNVFLVFTGGVRKANDVTTKIVEKTSKAKNDNALHKMLEFVDEATSLMQNSGENKIREVGSLLNESWTLKKSLSSNVSNKKIDDMIEFGLRNGALGAKLLGAGGNGFVLFIAPKKIRKILMETFGAKNCISFCFIEDGVQIIQ